MNQVQVPSIRKSTYDKARAIVLAARKAAAEAYEAQGDVKHAVRSKTPRKRKPEHGQHIYVFHHLQKNNVVYSLDKVMKNNAALRQLPYNGKKTVPAALRKDLWSPLAILQFPRGYGSVGLSAFQKLREYRKRHELEWGDEIRLDAEDSKKFEPIKTRGRKICDQKANSVADIAAVMDRWVKVPKAIERKSLVNEDGQSAVNLADEEAHVAVSSEGNGHAEEGDSSVSVKIFWRDLNDAEFAETWTDNVEHGDLQDFTARKARPSAPVPAPKDAESSTKPLSPYKQLRREIYEEGLRLTEIEIEERRASKMEKYGSA